MTEEPNSWGGAMWQSANKDPRTKTYRKNFTPKARVYHYAVDNVINKQRHDVLDFGAGKHNFWADKLGREGYSCDGYDLSLADRTMRDAYDVIMVSNVLNVQETRDAAKGNTKTNHCVSLSQALSHCLELCRDTSKDAHSNKSRYGMAYRIPRAKE